MNIGGFLQNDSAFGRLMTKCGTIIALNVLFVISCIPFFTIGAAGTGMYFKLSVSVAISHPLKMILVLFLNVIPAVLLYMDEINRPTYVFTGAFFGFGLIAYIVGKMLLSQFEPYLGMSKAD